MTVAPFVQNPEDNRKIFYNLRKLSVDIMSKKNDNISMNFLSMGMTGDYTIAVEEGADFIRTSTGLFERMLYKYPNVRFPASGWEVEWNA